MIRSRPGTRSGFTLIEILVVIAIIGILVALLIPAVQSVRESAASTQCQNNLRQLALAVHNFHDVHRLLPTYNGIFPAVKGATTQAANSRAIYGSWFVHILPFVEQQPLYEEIAADVASYGNTGALVTAPGGTLISPAIPASWTPPPVLITPAVPATYNQYTGSLQFVGTTVGNGYVIYTQQWVPPKTPDPGTGTPAVYDYTGSTLSPAVPAVYGPPGAPVNSYVGIWNPNVQPTTFSVLQCPSDPSGSGIAQSRDHRVYANTTGPWGATNYVANYNIFSGNPTLGYQAPSQSFLACTDGVSNTILFGEAYAWCEGRGRTALLAWHSGGGGANYGGVHNFGLTYSLAAAQVDTGNGPEPVAGTNGVANPSINPDINFYFQIRPDPVAKGVNGCDCMAAQTGHAVLNIALADGSVRSVANRADFATWLSLMQPADGQAINNDW